jgi:putative ABC transport system permease protein
MDHVVDVMPTLIKLNSCATNLDLVSIHGVDETVLPDFRTFDMIEGSLDTFTGESSAAIVGKELAQRRGWKVGEAADINGINFNIRGVYTDGGSTYDSLVMVHIDFLQQATGIGRGSHATQLYVKVDDGSVADEVARQIDEIFSTDVIQTDTKPESAFLAQGLSEFSEVVDFSQLLGYIAVALILLLVANTIYMATQDRVQEIAVLRTIGFSPERVIVLVIFESFFLSVIGGVIGVGAAFGILSSGNYGIAIEGYQVAFATEMSVFLTGLVSAAALGFLGGALPAVSASRIDIVEGLRKV